MIPVQQLPSWLWVSPRKFLLWLPKCSWALGLVAVCLVTSSCRKREPVSADAVGALKLQPAKFSDGIPDDYGPLIGVTQNPTDAAWVGLWFQRQDKSITAVFVNVNEGRIYQNTLTIPRK
ncbi:MAG TPA: hypothetical protein VNH84_08690 [Candidatus Saccharimonadales bacterium]|nr:hypothetical protein [Candidatus Saccharimonadales bacterium]